MTSYQYLDLKEGKAKVTPAEPKYPLSAETLDRWSRYQYWKPLGRNGVEVRSTSYLFELVQTD